MVRLPNISIPVKFERGFLIGTLSILVCLTGCRLWGTYSDGRLKLINGSDKDVCVFISDYNGIHVGLYLKNDNYLIENVDKGFGKYGSCVKKQSSRLFYVSNTSWPNTIRKLPQKKIILYVIDSEVAEKAVLDSIIQKDLYLKKFDLSIKELKKVNWQIKYPQ